jgi:MFS family permease
MKAYTTILLCVTIFFLYADQNLLAPNLTAIAKDFGFDDHERDQKLGGYIAIGFFIVGGPVALLVGYFTDICTRTILFGLVVTFGESACLATYWVRTYGQLFALRCMTGISIGGATPIIFSMLGDLYSGSHRIYVSTFVGLSLSAGVAAGQLLAGLIGPWLGWRAPFLLIAVPALCCAFTVAFTVEEPKRGDQEKALRMLRSTQTVRSELVDPVSGQEEWSARITIRTDFADYGADQPVETVCAQPEEDLSYSEKIEWAKVVQMFSTPSVVLIFIQGFPGCLPWGMICVFLNDYFSENRGMTVQAATAVLTTFSTGGLFGQVVGGWLGQRLYNKDPRYQCILMGFTTFISVFPILYLLNSSQVGDLGFFFMAVLGGFIVNMNGPNVRVVLQVRTIINKSL